MKRSSATMVLPEGGVAVIRSFTGLILAALLVAAASLPAWANREAVSDAELERLRAEILDVRERVGVREREERALLDVLEDVDRRLEQLSHSAAEAREASSVARAGLRSARDAHQAARTRLDATQEAMARRAVALYKSGDVGPVQVLFTSTSAQQLLTRVAMLEALVEHDAELVARYQRETAGLVAARTTAEEASVLSETAARRAAERGAELSNERAHKRQLLARVRDDRARERALLIELEKAAQALEETLAALGDTARSGDAEQLLSGGGFEAQRGGLPSPVDGKVERAFGRVVDAEFQTETIRKGVDFAARRGAPVFSVAFGEVRFAGWFRGYGKIAILDHGDQYFTVSGHLDEIAVSVGEVVAAGQRLGTVGDSGSLTGPGLYFEIRRGSEPLDPAGWLH